MNNHQIPVWATLALAGSLFAGSPIGASANTPQTPQIAGSTASSAVLAASIPTRLVAAGLINPIGSQVQLTWVPVPKALGYKIYRDGQFLAGSDHGFWIDYSVAGGETHTYTVTSVTLAGESSRSAAATAKVPLGGGQVLFADALQNSWSSWSWASVSVGSPSAALTPQTLTQQALRVSAGPWQALYLHHAKFSTASYSAVSFSIYGGAPAGQKLWLRATRNGVPQPPVALPTLASGQWQTVTISLGDLGVANVSDMDGIWVQDATGKTQAPFSLTQVLLTSAAVAPLAVPAGLTATPLWTPSCPKCGGMAMAHIVLAWNPVAGATSYTLYRNGVKLQDSLTAPSFTDMSLVSGQNYSYTVAAVGPSGASPQSAAASAVAPNPPSGALGVPFNITNSGAWTGALSQYGSPVSNKLAWSPSLNAASYNVYQSDVLIAHGLTTPAFTVTPDIIQGNALFTVTAVDNQGNESLPSAPISYANAWTAATVQSYNNTIPGIADTLAAVPDWNLGAPRITLSWHAPGSSFFNVYRDGVKVVSGLWQAYYIDTNVAPGSTHTYTVSAENTDWLPNVEGPSATPITATALQAAPASLGSKVQITKIVPNDNSAVIFFTPMPGATDYGVYDVTNPSKIKYAGLITQEKRYGLQPRTPICIEWNGIDPAKGADLVVEAVDKFGPFQRMDGTTMGTMTMAGMSGEAVNGQGDPSNVPNVLAQSDTFHVTCQPVVLTGSQVFFDNFQASTPLVRQPCPAPVADSPFYGQPHDFAVYENDKWQIRQYGADLTNSKVFFMGNHFMDTTYDGGGLGSSSPAHNNDATMVMMPKATADISGGKVLHVTFEVDAHMDSRRWCELLIGAPNDLLLNPAKFAEFQVKPTVSGNILRWQIQSTSQMLQLFSGDGTQPGVDLIQPASYADGQTMARIGWDTISPLANGTTQDLDKRHRFDLYLSKTHYRISETTPDGMYNIVREKDFPAGVTLPFDQCQIYFDHQVYHTYNDRCEQVEYAPFNSYWYNFRPYSDERHWDNMGFEVLSAFPAASAP